MKSVKILVLGDSGCGKSAFVHLYAHKQVSKRSGWTIGCNTEVSTHECSGKEYFIEFWDVGGNEKFSQSRSVFFKDANGLILVHDLSNKKSHANLRRWLHQVIREVGGSNEYVWSDELHVSTVTSSSSVSLPVLVVGTKLDLSSEYRHVGAGDENGLDSLYVSCFDVDTFKEGSHASQKMSSFFNRCIQSMLASRDSSSAVQGSYGAEPSERFKRTDSRRLSNSPAVRVPSSSSLIPSRGATGRLDDDDEDADDIPRRRNLNGVFQAVSVKQD